MKRLNLLILAIIVSFSVSAQTDTTKSKMHHGAGMNYHAYVMKNGKLMEMQNGQQTILTQDATLQNGTKITSSGEVIWKDGKTQQLTNGDRVDMNGKIHNNMGMDSKMKMKDENGKWKSKTKPALMDSTK